MNAIEIARRMRELGETGEAQRAYLLALRGGDGAAPEEEFEAAVYLFDSGYDYRVAYTSFQKLYNAGIHRPELLELMTGAFYEPNVKRLRGRYVRNCKRLEKYPYLFRKDFPDFEALPVRFYPFDERGYLPYDRREDRFGEYFDPKKTVVSRNFFRDLERPVLARDVFSQYELEYLNDNVRPSEAVGRENHVYLHYGDWETFCSYLAVLNLRPLLEDKKLVFLIGGEIEQYPIDFQARFGVDYSKYPQKPLGIREIHRMIWHTQLSSHNGGDFFNEILDGHPNLLAMPSIMFSNVEETVATVKKALKTANNANQAGALLEDWDRQLGKELYLLRDFTEKDIIVAMFLRQEKLLQGEGKSTLDKGSRIAPALFFQPHFSNMIYDLTIDPKGRVTLTSKQYEAVKASPIFKGFQYIKTFTPMRRFTNSHGATVKFMYRMAQQPAKEGEPRKIVPDAVCQRVLNRSFMIDWQDRLYADCTQVRFEDGKLNPRATFTALAAFLDLPYTESMTYCSLWGERDPESLEGNDLGFSTAALYRTYDEYANDSERYFIEYFLRDAYEYFGYDFKYYDGAPVDKKKVRELVDNFTTIDHYIRKTWEENILPEIKISRNGQELEAEQRGAALNKLVEQHMEDYHRNRILIGEHLLRGLFFVNKNGQPLHMMPKLRLDPALLEQPLYH